MMRAPNPVEVTLAMARVTFREVVRDKILYNIVVFSVLLIALGLLASKLSFGRVDRVILDFGVTAVALSCVAVSIFVGASSIGREFDRRTVYVLLSHPISRFQFVIGKFFGILLVTLANWALLSGSLLVILWFATVSPEAVFHSTLAWGLALVFFQGVLAAAISVMFSTFSTTSLSATITLGFYLIGANVSQIRMVVAKMRDPVSAAALNLTTYVLPNFEWFSLGSKVTYGLPVTWSFGLTAMLYGVVYTSACLVAAGLLIQTKEAA